MFIFLWHGSVFLKKKKKKKNLNVGVFLVLEGLENFVGSFLTFGILAPTKKLSCSI